jgi:hypothetical protein
MTDGADRREARRFLMSLPMRVLPREARSKELRANTRDVSYRGLYFLSETKFDVGHQIEFVLTLPEKVSPSGAVDIRCIGKVVRVEAGKNGTMGVAAQIERYEFLPASATAA